MIVFESASSVFAVFFGGESVGELNNLTKLSS